MNRNQILVISLCMILGIGIYLFAGTKKPKEEKPADSGHTTMPEQQQEEALDIEEYIGDINSRIEDKAVRQKIETLSESKNFKELLSEYVKLDKPLAVAHYTVRLAEVENKVESFVNAGDYNSMLMQTAPDA